MSNLQTVQEIYEAFGRGDIETIMSKLSDTVNWEYSGSNETVPWLKNRRGKEETLGFFQDLAVVDFNRFEPTALLDGGMVVVALIDIDLTVKKNGENIAEKDEVHVWRFDQDGKVSGFRHGADTLAHFRAYTS